MLILILLSIFLLGPYSSVSANDDSSAEQSNIASSAGSQTSELISGVTDSPEEGPTPSKEYGHATLKRISNLTSFPMFIDVGSAQEESSIPDNSVIRIKAIANSYGDKKPYVAARADKNSELNIVSYTLRSNCYDPEDSNCQFKITNIIDPSGKNMLQLSPLSYPGKYVLCDSAGQDKYLATCSDDPKNINSSKSYWSLEGPKSRCFLKNAASNGYLGPALVTETAASIREISLEADSTTKNKKACSFGDAISLQTKGVPLFLSVGSAEDSEKCFLGTVSSAQLILKGEHSDTDRYNAPFGKNIKNGDIVRLEHVGTGKNLSVSDKEVSFSGNISWTSTDLETQNNYQHFMLKLNGKDGFGDYSDNWTITFADPSPKLYLGTTFMLQHLATKTFLTVEMATEKTGTSASRPLVTAVKIKDSVLEEQNKQSLEALKADAEKTQSSKETKPQSSAKKDAAKPKRAKADAYLNTKIWLINKIKSFTLDQKDLMRTGFYEGTPYERISTEHPGDNNQQFAIEVVSTGGQSFIQAKTDLWKTVPLSTTSIQLSGLLEEDVPDLLPGSTLSVQPMLGKGILWIEKSLATSNKFSMSFVAQVNDQSELAIVLGNDLSDNYKYKLILGAGNNDQTILLKREQEAPPYNDIILTKASISDAAAGKLRLGVPLPLWIIFNDGLFLAGQSDTLGENLLLAFQELGFSGNIDRIGFSCNKAPISISDIQLGPTLQASAPARTYQEKIAAPTSLSNNFTNKGFRQADQLFGVFHCKKFATEQIILGSQSHDNQYILDIDSNNKSVRISEKKNNTSVMLSLFNRELLKHANQETYLWVNYNNGLFLGGVGATPGLNPEFVFQAEKPLEDITVFSYSPYGSIDKVSSNSGSSFELVKNQNNQSNFLNVETNRLVGINPYQYTLSQIDDWVTIKDFISKKTYSVTRTPQKGADYSLMLSIDTAGLPKMRWAWQPENEELMKQKFKGRVMTGIAEGLAQASMNISGVGEIGETIAVGVNVGITAATIAPAISAAKLRAAATYDYLAAADTAAIADEQSIKKASSLKTSDSKAAIMNRYAVEKTLGDTKDVSASTREDFFLILSKCKKVVSLTTSNHVLGTDQLKNSFFRSVDALYGYQKELFAKDKKSNQKTEINSSSQELIGLLVDACNNPFIFDEKQIEDVAKRTKWMAWGNLLFRDLLASTPTGSIDIPPLFGNFFWLEQKLPTKGQGKITFMAKGSGKLSIAFARKNITSINSGNYEFYSIDILNSEAVTCSLKLSSFGSPALQSKDDLLALNPIDFKKYWITLDQGIIKVGITNNLDDDEELFSFQDPYPLKDETTIGLGTFNAQATVQNIQVSPLPPKSSAETA